MKKAKKAGDGRTECACATCQRSCENTPGWFRPGEAEKAAAFMGLTLRAFFTKYLGVDWWCDSINGDVFALAPALVGAKPGAEYPANPRGTCVFFTKDRRCQIHEVKPFGCAFGNPCSAEEEGPWHREHQVTVEQWRGQQAQIVTLLKHKPVAEDMSFMEAFFL